MAAAAAFARSVTASLADPIAAEIAAYVARGDLDGANRLLEARLREDGDDIVAVRLAGDVATRAGRIVEAEGLYRRCIDLCPSYVPARYGLSRLLFHQARLGEAAHETERMLAVAPTDPTVRTLKAAVAANVGDHDDAAALYQGLAAETPAQPAFWLGLGHSHRTMGRTGDAIAAYRRAAALPTGEAEALWSLSNLKTDALGDADIRRLAACAGKATGRDAIHVHFALGQALDARDERDGAFGAFSRGNAAVRATMPHEATGTGERLRRWTEAITPYVLASRAGEGEPSSAPIFIVGLPRSGSTLVEQILGSHSSIESTTELPYMDRIATRLARSGMQHGRERTTPDLGGVDLARLGREYLAAARAHRKTTKPFFIDKLPGNFAHAGLIKLMLPNARIIDVRRHPLAATWSVFKQLFAGGQSFAYDLLDIAHWYRGYAAALAHFDGALPSAIHRIHYEALVDDTEGQVRLLLDHVGVPFEPGCLAFYESGNAVRTPSSEQVRRPIFHYARDDWRRYADRLTPAAEVLATEMAAYRVPAAD